MPKKNWYLVRATTSTGEALQDTYFLCGSIEEVRVEISGVPEVSCSGIEPVERPPLAWLRQEAQLAQDGAEGAVKAAAAYTHMFNILEPHLKAAEAEVKAKFDI